RYGGIKQIDPIGPNGEIIIDYSVFDAIRAGFGKVVFIIRKSIEAPFRERVGKSIEKNIDTRYVFQELDTLPAGLRVPSGREKPWGTGHAILMSRGEVDEPFAVLNADDFYGAHAFKVLGEYLVNAKDKGGRFDYSLVGYVLRNTLSENGSVARGVCTAGPDGMLVEIHERTKIQPFPEGVKFEENGAWYPVSSDSLVSMNMWGFTPSLYAELEARFPAFLKANIDKPKAEFFIPEVVGSLVRENKAQVRVLATHEKWFGVTYKEDKPVVEQALRDLIARGAYPHKLWK
ncbi:MAG: nucleotidyltransferase, partial [Fibrobacterota bacterium]